MRKENSISFLFLQFLPWIKGELLILQIKTICHGSVAPLIQSHPLLSPERGTVAI